MRLIRLVRLVNMNKGLIRELWGCVGAGAGKGRVGRSR